MDMDKDKVYEEFHKLGNYIQQCGKGKASVTFELNGELWNGSLRRLQKGKYEDGATE